MLGRRAGIARAAAAGRRAWPVLLMAWERWQQLPEEDKARYRRQAREYAERGRRALDGARRRRGGGTRGRGTRGGGTPGSGHPY